MRTLPNQNSSPDTEHHAHSADAGGWKKKCRRIAAWAGDAVLVVITLPFLIVLMCILATASTISVSDPTYGPKVAMGVDPEEAIRGNYWFT
jgi:hypothetical protein